MDADPFKHKIAEHHVQNLSTESAASNLHDNDADRFQEIEKAPPLRDLESENSDSNHDPEPSSVNAQPSLTPVPSSEHTDHEHPPPRLGIRARLRHFTWAWYTLSMSTGGLSLLIINQPHQFPGLRQIGLAVYIINIIIFTLITSALVSRFFLFAGSLKRSVTHPREGFFVPTSLLSVATLITSTQKYIVGDGQVPDGEKPGLRWAVQAAFWLYVALSTCLAVGQYGYVFAGPHSFGLQTMTPAWILPIFPVMLSGTAASVIAGAQPAGAATPIIVAGLTCQGLGVSVAAMMYAHMVGRLMQSGLPDREHRPGLFMCVGPPAFTALAFIGLAGSLPEEFDADMDGMLDATVMASMATTAAGFLWALSFWWFCIAVLAVAQNPPRHFHLGWWASVFPNTGLVLATISLGTCFRNEPVLWFATAMSILLLLTFCFVLFHHVRALVVQDILYPGRDEDVE
ncbi:voltage-dependent anion channel-domain-containing protein [Cladorrhinum samala]|uniref:Voltage-dependent anion channel-domain-containing protein n=1 Tax=Cladorrhinum samala TaxID=585594 RepID=A0AAV9HJZ5_9PEZI|nr:voltage-dependent anion channel-domain-containing protein [Cladorrhinum samala]